MRQSVPDEATCAICGRHFDPSDTRGWCPNPSCGEWRHPSFPIEEEGETAEDTGSNANTTGQSDRPTKPCPHCGEAVREDARFCKHCVSPIDEEDEAAAAAAAEEEEDEVDSVIDECPDCGADLSQIPEERLSSCPICMFDLSPVVAEATGEAPTDPPAEPAPDPVEEPADPPVDSQPDDPAQPPQEQQQPDEHPQAGESPTHPPAGDHQTPPPESDAGVDESHSQPTGQPGQGGGTDEEAHGRPPSDQPPQHGHDQPQGQPPAGEHDQPIDEPPATNQQSGNPPQGQPPAQPEEQPPAGQPPQAQPASGQPQAEPVAPTTCPNCGEDLTPIPPDMRTVCPGCRVDLDEGQAMSEARETTDEPAVDPTTPLDTMDEIAAGYLQRLSDAGIETIGELVRQDPDDLAATTGVSARRISGWIEDAPIDPDDVADMPEPVTSDDDEAVEETVIQPSGPGDLYLDVMGTELAIEDGETVGKDVRSAMVEQGAPEDDAVYVHRKHVRFDIENNAWVLTRLGQNSLEVNGQEVAKGDQIQITDGDEIDFSDVVTTQVDIR